MARVSLVWKKADFLYEVELSLNTFKLVLGRAEHGDKLVAYIEDS